MSYAFFWAVTRPAMAAVTAMTLLFGPALTRAQTAGASVETAVVDSSRQWLDAEVARAPGASGMPLRMEVSVGTLDPRLRLAPCTRVEPYLPPGVRLWGKTRFGLRCVEGASRWNVFLPVTVKAFGPAWVARGPIVSGAVLALSDAMEAEVDWADEASPVMSNAAQWVGTVTTRSIAAGQALRVSAVRPPQVFQAGAQVRIVAQGAGFAITSDGQAVSAGVVGQSVRVRVEGGRMMTGTVQDAHTVRIDI